MPVEDAYRTEQDYTQRLSSYKDSGEAMAAFLEKREPSWSWS
jgi:enoyl-CoA hydratase